MRQLIRHRQGVIHAISPNNGNTRFLKGAHYVRGGGIVGALYNYQENLATPPAGSIYHSSSSNNLKINVVDANGINHQSAIQNLSAGDKITIGTQSSYLTGTPGITSGVALVPVQSWPNYTNGQYSVTIEKGVLPYTTVAPSISGSNLIGSTLTCAPGTWDGKPTPSPAVRQWKADGVNISGETGLTYVIAAGYAGKNITCVETATSLTGTASSSSNQIFAGITPTNITAPTVTGEGTPGEVLTCGTGTWEADPAATYTKQWRRDGSNISGQTADTYTVLAGDVGKTITCAVTATNTISAVTAISNGILVTAAVGNPPVNTSAPVISGTGQVGSILSLTSQGTWTGTPPINYTYQWQRDGANTGNTGNSYVVQAGDDGLTITCRVTGTNVDGVTNASSNGILCSPPAFSPAFLFASGEQGVWYDPSDLTTMFQDRAGTTPVTADGQPVGLILDKSKGLVLGSETVAYPIQGIFGTSWTNTGTTVLRNGSTGTAVLQTQGLIGLSTTSLYKISFSVADFSGDSFGIRCAGGAAYGPISGNGNKTVYLYGGGTVDVAITFLAWGGDAGTATISNISVKELAGNHATAPSDAARPLYKTDGTYHWLQFDGVDDNLTTGNIDFTSTDKMSSFVGWNKVGGSNAIVVRLGTDTADTAGGFYSGAINPTTSQPIVGARSTTGSALSAYSNPAMPNNVKHVQTGIINIPGAALNDILKIRLDGAARVLTQNDAGPIGTGTFGNLPLKIGDNNQRLDGTVYSIIILGRLATTQEITDTETWVAAKTGVTLP